MLQYLAWMLIALLVIEMLGPLAGVSVPPVVQPGNLLKLLVFFALGFLLYSAAFAMAGAIAADEQNLGQLLWPVMVALVVPMLVMPSVLISPDGTVAVALSLIPVTAPVVMFMRVLVGDPGALQVAVSVAGMALATVGAVWAAAKVFRLGILLTGTKGTLARSRACCGPEVRVEARAPLTALRPAAPGRCRPRSPAGRCRRSGRRCPPGPASGRCSTAAPTRS